MVLNFFLQINISEICYTYNRIFLFGFYRNFAYNLKKGKIMIDFSQFDSLIAMTMYFNNEDVCKNAIIETRWGVGEKQDFVCPYCGKHHCKLSKSGRFHCTACNHNFSCKVGTIFEDSNLSLVKWFIAMYLISSHKKGISSHQWQEI